MIPYLKELYAELYADYLEHTPSRYPGLFIWFINNIEVATYGNRRNTIKIIKKYPLIFSIYKQTKYKLVTINYSGYLEHFEKNIQIQLRLEKIKKLRQ